MYLILFQLCKISGKQVDTFRFVQILVVTEYYYRDFIESSWETGWLNHTAYIYKLPFSHIRRNTLNTY